MVDIDDVRVQSKSVSAAQVRDAARRRLADQVAEAAAKAERAETAAAVVWRIQGLRAQLASRLAESGARADLNHATNLAKTLAKLDQQRAATLAKARAVYDAAIASLDTEIASAVQSLLGDGYNTTDVAALTGLSPGSVRKFRLTETPRPINPDAGDPTEVEQPGEQVPR